MDNRKLNKKIDNLKLANEGLLLEYQYVVQKNKEKFKEELEKEKEMTEYYKKEFDEVVKKLEECKSENEAIKNSRWWKLREKIKGKK